MAQETKNVGIGLVLSLLITIGVSLSARAYFDHHPDLIARSDVQTGN